MEIVLFLKVLFAFIFVIALMYLFSWLVKKMGLASNIAVDKSQSRLKIVEFLPIDHSNKLVIVKRDSKEHLLLLSPNGSTVIENDIQISGSLKK